MWLWRTWGNQNLQIMLDFFCDSIFNLKIPWETTFDEESMAQREIYWLVATLWWSRSVKSLLPRFWGSHQPFWGLPSWGEPLRPKSHPPGDPHPVTDQYGNIRAKPSPSCSGQFWKVIPASDGLLRLSMSLLNSSSDTIASFLALYRFTFVSHAKYIHLILGSQSLF